jgi:ubiquinone/menaquinone biosynthesis C-methylase UbiE/uncharacterized protein YbaR (Trm112 family)
MMRTKLLPILASPCCKAEIRLEGFNNETGDSKVSEGILTCVACQTEYPIINGIPRFVIELSEEEKSALSNIKSQGLVIREQTKNDDVSSEDIYKKIERIIREYEAPHAGKSEYAKQKYEKDLNYRIYGCEIQDKFVNTLKKYYTGSMGTFVDVGAGQGGLTKCFNEYFKSELSIIVDYDIKWVKVAQLRNPNTDIFRGDATRLPFKDGTIDFVMSQAMLEHIKDYSKAANELCRITKKVSFISWNPNKYSIYDFGHLEAPVTLLPKSIAPQVAKWWHGLRKTGRSYESIVAELNSTFYIATTHIKKIMQNYGVVHNVFTEFGMNSLKSEYTHHAGSLKKLLKKMPFVARLFFSTLAFLKIEPICYYILIKQDKA